MLLRCLRCMVWPLEKGAYMFLTYLRNVIKNKRVRLGMAHAVIPIPLSMKGHWGQRFQKNGFYISVTSPMQCECITSTYPLESREIYWGKDYGPFLCSLCFYYCLYKTQTSTFYKIKWENGVQWSLCSNILESWFSGVAVWTWELSATWSSCGHLRDHQLHILQSHPHGRRGPWHSKSV